MKNRATKVLHEGDKHNCILVLVGEQPGRTEVRTRRPFSGPAGHELDFCLNAAGVPRMQCYTTNVIKDLDYPLEYYMKFSKGTISLSEDGREYVEILKNELSDCKANVIVAIGNSALYALTGRVGVTSWRGSILESALLPRRKVIPVIHPSTVIPPKNVYLNRRLIIGDLIRAKEQAEFPEMRIAHREVKINPTCSDIKLILHKVKTIGLKGYVVFFDIEVYNNNVSCISFAISPNESVSIPFIDSSGDKFSIEDEASIWLLIAEILENPNIRKGGQNLVFDCSILLSQFGIKTKNVAVDTMINQKIILPDYPVGLDFITSILTDIPYYKAEGKKWYKVGGAWEKLWHYNGLDSIACAAAHPQQMLEIEKQNNIATVVRQTKVVEPLIYMMNRGIKVDVEGMKKAHEEMLSEISTLQERLNSLVGFELNPNSPKQLSEYLYGVLGHKPYLKGGKVTTDETAMTRLLRKGVKEAELVKRIRQLTKLSSTYTDTDKISDDGRLRCSYNPVGARTGRLSSSADIFDKGMNMQNWPHPLLKFLLADEGYVIYSVDLSQAENRIVAYVGRVPRMIRAFENGEDVHRLTAGLIFGKDPSEISDEEGSSPLGGGMQSERYWGKQSNHALNYDLGYRTFALKMELPELEAKWLVERFHGIYPEIRGNYHQQIRLQLSNDRTLTNLYGRRRVFLDRWDDDLFKSAYAQIPQSTVADKINEEGLNYIYYNQDRFSEVELLAQIHDDITFQIPLSTTWTRHAEILLDIKKSLETSLRYKDAEFIIPLDITMNLNLYKETGMEFKHSNIPTTVETLAIKLERSYESLKK